MKKLLGILILGLLLLTSCSEYQTKKALVNCADTKYSKKMAKTIHIYIYVMEKGISKGNEFEQNLFVFRDAKIPMDVISDYISELLSKENLKENEKREFQGVMKTVNSFNFHVKKFLKSNLEVKLKKSPIIHYKHLFEQCELKQQQTPNTFNSLWKNADIKYI